MILDSSAIVAVVLQEPGHQSLLEAMAGAEVLGVGAPTLAETGLGLVARIGPTAPQLVASFLADLDVVVAPFDSAHWAVAVGAFARYGKGRHAAASNFGDCLTYATAMVAGEPLLCHGSDFGQTDLEMAS